MMDDDEDVVFENSALHQHLKESGVNEEYLEAEKKVESVSSGESLKSEEMTSTQSRKSFGATFKRNICNFVFDEVWCREIKTLGRKHAAKVTEQCLQSCDILVEEDLAFVDSFSSTLKWDAYEEETDENSAHSDDSIMGQMLTQVGILGVTIAYGFFRMFYMKSTEVSTYAFIYALDLLSVLLTVVALAPASLKFALAGRFLSRLEARSDAVTKVLDQIQHEQKVFSKAILFVREAELMRRGFTLVKASTVQQESSGSSCQYPDLRRTLFMQSRRIFYKLRSASKSLLTLDSKLLGNDMSSDEYLTNMPLERFGPCVVLKESEKELLEKETDNYCLAAIQGMVELENAQISEFLRVLCVLCLQQAECLHNLPIRGFHSYCETIEEVMQELKDDCKSLEKVFTLNKTLAAKLDELSAKNSQRQKSSNTQSKMIYTAVHSLMMHLHVAVSRLKDTEADLEQLVESGEGEVGEETLETVMGVVEGVRINIMASKDCCDEAVNRIEKLVHPQDQQSDKDTEEPLQVDSTTVKENQASLIVIPQSNPVVEDEVFEGFTNDRCLEEEDYSYMFSEDKKTRRDKAEVMRLLTELQSVIAARAADTKEREARALARRAAGPNQGFSPCVVAQEESETLEKCNNAENSVASLPNGDNSVLVTSNNIIDLEYANNDTDIVDVKELTDRSATGTNFRANAFNSHHSARLRDMSLQYEEEYSRKSAENFEDESAENNKSADHESRDKSRDESEGHHEGQHGSTLTSFIAQLAVMKSKQIMPDMNVETFGDDSDDDDNNDDDEEVNGSLSETDDM